MDQSAESKPVERELLRLNAHSLLLGRMYDLIISRHEPSVSLIFLFASIIKLRHMGTAVQLLAGHAYVEEIRAIGRTMAEVVVNAAYLQNAEDEEIDRFRHFDTQSSYKHAKKLELRVTTQLSAEENKKIEAVADHARSLTGRKDSDPSWSKRTLMQRAEHTDLITRLNLISLLVLTSYAYGHSAIHGTFDALDPFISSINSNQLLTPANRQEELSVSLSSVNFSLSVMCLFLNSMFHLDLDSAITDAGQLNL